MDNFENVPFDQDELDEAIRSAVAEAVENALEDKLGDAVKEAIDDVLEDAVAEAVEDAVKDAVEDAVDGAVENALQQSPSPFRASRLFILSQDKKHLGEFVSAHIWGNAKINVNIIPNNTQCFGAYATEEEAVAELGRLADALAALKPGETAVYRMK